MAYSSLMRVYFTSAKTYLQVVFTYINGSLLCSQNEQQIGKCFGARFKNENLFRYLEYEELPILEYNVHIGNSSKPFLFRYPPTPPPEPPPAAIESYFLEWVFGALFIVLVLLYTMIQMCPKGRRKRVFTNHASEKLSDMRQPRFT